MTLKETPARCELDTVAVGRELTLCQLGFGTGTVGGGRNSNQTRLGQQTFEALLRYGYERGIRFFDLAEDYGSHPYAGRALKEFDRSSYQLVTKMVIHIPEEKRKGYTVPIDRYLNELQTDYIDLLQLHCILDREWPLCFEDFMGQLSDLKERGIIRAHGVACHDFGALELAVDHSWVDALHVRINPHGKHMDADLAQVLPVLDKAKANGKGVIGMKLFAQGDVSAEEGLGALRWVRDIKAIDVVTVGFQDRSQIDAALNVIVS